MLKHKLHDMKLYEAQVKALLALEHLPIPRNGNVACEEYAVKAQILSGGRGKLGLIKFATPKNLTSVVAKLKKNCLCEVLIEEKVAIEKEIYLSFSIVKEGIQLLLGSTGGVNVESENNFLKMIVGTTWKDKGQDSYDNQIKAFLAPFLGASIDTSIFKSLHNFLLKYDLLFLEINPLVITKGTFKKDNWKILDAKAILDDNALYRQTKALKVIRKALPVVTNTFSNYIPLDGDIACVINGAGLAMATQDAIVVGGGKVANFLDLGGGTSIEKVEEILNSIFNDQKISSVLFNLFGGIVNCKTIATSILKCLAEDNTVKIIVRMEGNGSTEAKKMLQKSKKITVVESYDKAIALVLKVEKIA